MHAGRSVREWPSCGRSGDVRQPAVKAPMHRQDRDAGLCIEPQIAGLEEHGVKPPP